MTARPPEDSERGYSAYGDSSGPTSQYAYGEYGQQYAGQPDPYAAPTGQYTDPATQYTGQAGQYTDPAGQYPGQPGATAYGGSSAQYDPAGQFPDPSQADPPGADSRPGMGSARPPRGRPAGERGFLGSLLDLDFASFVTPQIIKRVYLLAVMALGLSAIAFIVDGFGVKVPFGVVTRIILAAVSFLLGLAFFRVVLEFFMVVFRMAEDLHDIRERGGSGSR